MIISVNGLWRKIRPYLGFILIALAVGGLSGFLSSNAMEQFETLSKPRLAPPGWLFPLVWTILYTLMGISAALVWKKSCGGEKKQAIYLWLLQLLVNFFWPIFFFVFEYRLLAFFWLLLLIILVVLMIRDFSKISKTAAWLQLPYLIWIIFAAYLNYSVYLLNK